MVLIGRLGETITGKIWRQGNIGLRVEVDSVEGRGDYRGRCIEGGTDLIPPG